MTKYSSACISDDRFFPVFIVGASRSGTTMLGRIIGNSREVAFCRELHFFEEMWVPVKDPLPLNKDQALEILARLLGVQERGYLFLGRSSTDHWRDEADVVLRQLGQVPLYPQVVHSAFLRYVAKKSNKFAAVEHTPAYALYAEEILHLYPEARIIHLVRDPRDVFLSQRKKWQRWRMSRETSGFTRREAVRAWANYHPYVMSKLWGSAICSVKKVESDPRVRVVRFEDLTSSPEAEVRGICDFLGITYSPAMLLVPARNSSKASDHPEELGISARLAQSTWKDALPRADLTLCEKLLGPLMTDYGYSLSGASAPLGQYVVFGSLPLKAALSLGLNLKRTRNLGQSISRRLLGTWGSRTHFPAQ